MIAGKPVVAFKVDGMPEIVKDGENGFLIEPGFLGGFSDKILQILRDPDLRKKFSENAKKSIDSSFDIHEMVRRQEKLYDTLMDEVPSRS